MRAAQSMECQEKIPDNPSRAFAADMLRVSADMLRAKAVLTRAKKAFLGSQH